jgi:transcriptional regulator with XRE-family HTH domain
MSQRTLAKAMGVSASAVAQWETGETVPTLDHRVELCRVLSIEIADLLPEAEHLTPILVSHAQTVLLVRKFEELPPSVREATLMNVVALWEALKGKPPD